MAPTLTSSNSFLLGSTPRSRVAGATRAPRLTVHAKASADDDSSASGGFGRFPNFNFGKMPDVKSLVPAVNGRTSPGLSFGNARRKDPSTVFVAGASGQAGVRIAQKLLREGFSVRAGVPELGVAQELAQLAASYKIISIEESKRLNAVESAFEDAETIAKAIGNATKVVVTIGPTESSPVSAVTPADALKVVEAAKLASVGHVAIVYDGSALGSTYNVLDGISSFFNTLFSREQPLTFPEFLDKLVETDISYTLIKTKLTEDYSAESEYSLVVTAERSSDESSNANDYKVAKSQIAKLVADVFSNTAVAENKVVEVFTDPSAPSKSTAELFSAIPEDGRRKAYAEALAKAKAEEEATAAAERAREAAEAAKKLEEQVNKLSKQEAEAADLAEEAREKAEAAGISMENIFSKAKGFGSGLSLDKFGSQIASAVQKTAENQKVQIATVRGQAKARGLPAIKAVVKKAAAPAGSGTVMFGSRPKPKEGSKPKPRISRQEEEPKKEVRKVFGGLFKQETIYIDED